MLIRKPLIFFTLVFAIVAVFAASEVLAAQCGAGDNTADYECNDGVVENYTVRIVKPFPLIADCANSSGKCSTWRWNISPDALSHFDLIVERSFGAAIVDDLSGTPLSTLLDCDGSGDVSQGGSDFARLLTWHCVLQVPTDASEEITHSISLRGEFAAGPTDWYVKQAECDYGDPDCDFRGDFGITQGLAEPCEEAPAGGVIFEACVNWYGDPQNTMDDVSLKVTRMGDAQGCIMPPVEFYVGINCDPDAPSQPINGEQLAQALENYVSSGILSGQTCDNGAMFSDRV
jgi:hypothetical protein